MTYKHSVIIDDFTDVMIHPKPVFNKLKDLWKQYLSETKEKAGWAALKQCTACGGKDIYKYFTIWGYSYSRCLKCASVFLDPHPQKQVYEKAFFDSPISEFVNSGEFQDQHAMRFKRVIEPLLSDMVQTSKNNNMSVLEVFGRNLHVLNYINSQQEVKKYYRFEAGLKDETNRSIFITKLDQIEDNSCDLILLLMSVEQMRTPQKMFPLLANKLTEKGRILVLARLGSGIDVQILRGNNPSVFPLEHIHLFSVEGYEHLCEKSGLEILELSTPGLLDVEYLQQYFNSHSKDDNVFQYFFQHRSSIDIERLQQFIQAVRLSSALKLICKRK